MGNDRFSNSKYKYGEYGFFSSIEHPFYKEDNKPNIGIIGSLDVFEHITTPPIEIYDCKYRAGFLSSYSMYWPHLIEPVFNQIIDLDGAYPLPGME